MFLGARVFCYPMSILVSLFSRVPFIPAGNTPITFPYYPRGRIGNICSRERPNPRFILTGQVLLAFQGHVHGVHALILL